VGTAAALGLHLSQDAKAFFAAERKMMPLQGFVDGPVLSRFSLSPDGKSLAAVMNTGEKALVITRDLISGKTAVVMGTDNIESVINWVKWANDKRLLVSQSFPFVRQFDETSIRQTETRETRLFAFDADGGHQINMVKKSLTQAGTMSGQFSPSQDDVIDFLPDDPDHILLTLRHDDYSYGTVVYKVNVNTAERTLYEAPRSNIDFLGTDAAGRVRVGVEYDNRKGGSTIWVCSPDGSNWRKLAVSRGPFDRGAISPLGFGLDPNILYVSAQLNGLDAIHTMDLREEKPTLALKLSDPNRNLNGSLVYDPKGEAVGINMAVSSGSSRYYWGADYKAMQAKFDQVLPNRWNWLADLSRFGGRYLLVSEEPGLPPVVLLGNLPTGQLDMLSPQYPELDNQRIPRKKAFSFKARDGFLLHAFLTTPLDSKHKNLPLVVMPHGGPQEYDSEEFNFLSTFVADRGYAVLQVNFRGSTGYGWDYMKAGLRRWGLETQDDLTDGVKKLIADGVVDPARISIVGWSFGGYAALNGVIKDPDLYKGAFAIAPVTNLIDLTSDWYSFGQREVFRQQIGDASADEVQLRATSPVFHADKIKVPVVLVHGTLDRSAEYANSVQMDEALTKSGKKHKFISFDKADHSLSHRPYRKRMFTELEAFLQETLGPGVPADA